MFSVLAVVVLFGVPLAVVVLLVELEPQAVAKPRMSSAATVMALAAGNLMRRLYLILL
jgi:hypothetical protein